MTEADRVLAECAAHPDDDAPRLVWADLVGGERGELVVIQCDLARGGLSRSARDARRARERDLLERHAVAWAGELATAATRWSFRRGFVEAARFARPPDAALLRRWPLLSSISVVAAAELSILTALPHLRGLGLETGTVNQMLKILWRTVGVVLFGRAY